MVEKRLTGVSLLLVEDEPQLVDLFSTLFRREGAQVDIAVNGQSGLEMAQTNSYQLIITDIRMSIMSGKELVVGARQSGLKTPIICISGFSDYTEEEILDWGANAFFEKPFRIEDLVQEVLSWVVSKPSE